MSRVLVPEFVPEAALGVLRAAGHVRFEPDLHARRDALLAALADADALVVRNQTRVDAALLAAAPSLRVVGRVGVGLDNFELEALRSRGIVLTYTPGANAASVAEYVIGAVLTVYRRFAAVDLAVRAGGWDREAATGREVAGSYLGIVGLGDIGSRVAARGRALGMRVLASDPYLHAASAAVQENEVALLSLPEVLERSDVVSLHAPLTVETRQLIGAAELGRMKPSALLVNTGRGALVDERALAAALASDRPGFAVLDVRDPEPPGPDDPLARLDNVLLTPHVAGVTHEALARAACHAARDVVRVLAGEQPFSPVLS